jgi:hypothetical protein
MNPADQLARLRSQWPQQFGDGARCGFLRRDDGVREAGGYPRGFHDWAPDARNAWYCGYNKGRCDRVRLAKKGAMP